VYEDKVSSCVKGSKPRERYHSVNLTPKHTVEVRIFKGAESEEELRSRIEFTMALLEFTRNASIKELTHEKFEGWLKSQGKFYKNLK
jgi:hypothetical protein